jgi:hypothetical protein
VDGRLCARRLLDNGGKREAASFTSGLAPLAPTVAFA